MRMLRNSLTSFRHGFSRNPATSDFATSLYGGAQGLDIGRTSVSFCDTIKKVPLSADIVGRIFNGSFRPKDGAPLFIPERWTPITGAPIKVLEEMVLPGLKSQIKKITQYIGERERESFYRLKRAKNILTAKETGQSLRTSYPGPDRESGCLIV